MRLDLACHRSSLVPFSEPAVGAVEANTQSAGTDIDEGGCFCRGKPEDVDENDGFSVIGFESPEGGE